MNTIITIAIILLVSSVVLMLYFMFENHKAVSKYLSNKKVTDQNINLEKYSKAS
jgi:hypothetical protein